MNTVFELVDTLQRFVGNEFEVTFKETHDTIRVFVQRRTDRVILEIMEYFRGQPKEKVIPRLYDSLIDSINQHKDMHKLIDSLT